MVMTLNDNLATRNAAFAQGADGFIGKTEFHAQALRQIRSLFGRPHGYSNDNTGNA